MRLPTDEAETHGDSATSSSSCDPFSLHAIEEWKNKFNIVVKATRKLKGSQEEEVAESPGGVLSNLRATSSPSLQAFMDAISRQEVALTLLKNFGSSPRSARDRVGEPANHSEAAAFGPSPSKFAKTDVVVRYVDFLV
ncbi:hypothetical protein E2C01_088779 [Portunus trituberculatus]|uniref:Uncharacterized protein n=1 Tax=Portunus trituberculatus TaxID=210409 RepID=A0A5B7JBQ0_PORTR|nr:hypothetical protein [Portunus trituberculatus]